MPPSAEGLVLDLQDKCSELPLHFTAMKLSGQSVASFLITTFLVRSAHMPTTPRKAMNQSAWVIWRGLASCDITPPCLPL
ncbi:unnamed protein product [Rodentolepis nana]|uniref:Uncharacterized protein n=1 Tax=Rodentolepis nana TaxID=102285 RepID=A0A0R3TXC0_RODNA|nr:unnamed protein product [Rodentolepis nana]